MKYSVLVGNVGTVCATDDHAEAMQEYCAYIEVSRGEAGRAAGESVTLFEDGEPIAEHEGYQDFFEGLEPWQAQHILSRNCRDTPTECPICFGSTKTPSLAAEEDLFDGGKDVRYYLSKCCDKCGFRYKVILCVVGVKLEQQNVTSN